MDFDLEHLARKRPVPILNRLNWRSWFQLFKLHIIGQELDFILDQTESEYTLVKQYTPATTPSTVSDPVEDLTKGIKDLKVDPEKQRWNAEKKEKYKAGSAKVLYLIMICIGPLDRALIKPLESTKAKWDKLYKKYSVIKPQEKREDLQNITHFVLPDGKLIEDAWIELIELGGRVVTANPLLASAYTEDTLFEFFLQGLPEERYSVTRAALDAQDQLDTTEKLLILQKRESQLKDSATNKALLAKNSRRYRPYKNRESSGSDSGHTPKKPSKHYSKQRLACYLCGDKHVAQDCDLRDEVLKFVRKLKRSRDTAKHKSYGKQKDTPKTKKSSRFYRGHVANDTSDPGSISEGDDESSATEPDSTELESEHEIEIAAISKEAISKIQLSQ
jgi:hypothetical protein